MLGLRINTLVTSNVELCFYCFALVTLKFGKIVYQRDRKKLHRYVALTLVTVTQP